MEFNKIRKIAIKKGIKTYRMRKTDLIRAIQRFEKSVECYGKARAEHCTEKACWWKDNCLSVYRKGISNP